MTYFSQEQVDRLLAPINPGRVEDLRGLAYVAQHDIRAHMNRMFGFGRWSTKVTSTEFIFEEQDKNGRWKAAYRAVVAVSVCAPDGTPLATYEDAHASGNAPQPDRAEAHALALTSAVSTAFKRACTNLGDQFGLSLYEKGQRTAFVKGTLVTGEELVPSTSIPSAEVLALTDEVYTFAQQSDSSARILAVAGFKTKNAAMLDAVTSHPVDGSAITIGLLADQVAAGVTE